MVTDRIIVFNECFIRKDEIQSCVLNEPDEDCAKWNLRFTFTNGAGIIIYRDSEEEINKLFKWVVEEIR